MGAYFRNQHELILHFTYGKSRPMARHDLGNVLRVSRETPELHPTEKPEELMRLLVSAVTLPGETVLDPFAGSGTTGAACMAEGREFVGIECEPRYCEIANARIAEAARKHQPSLEGVT
jgi:site-specific DNA-methyltransferase (adenine-specific)